MKYMFGLRISPDERYLLPKAFRMKAYASFLWTKKVKNKNLLPHNFPCFTPILRMNMYRYYL